MNERCIFCGRSDVSFSKEAHIFPESAGNKNLVLPPGHECHRCNNGFSADEQHVLRTAPGQLFRVAFVDKTKRGAPPTADIQGGKLRQLDSVGTPTLQIRQYGRNPNSRQPAFETGRTVLGWQSQPFSAPRVSAVLAKISLEYFCLLGLDVYTHEYDGLRNCAKSHGTTPFIPFFIGLHAEPTQKLELVDSNAKMYDLFRPVCVKFPGFSGVIPTASTLPHGSMDVLKSFIHQKVSENLLFIKDPRWSKPIRVNLTLTEVRSLGATP